MTWHKCIAGILGIVAVTERSVGFVDICSAISNSSPLTLCALRARACAPKDDEGSMKEKGLFLRDREFLEGDGESV